MDGTPGRRNSAKQRARTALMVWIIFQQFTVRQRVQHIVQRKVFRNHFLMGVQRETDLTGANLLADVRRNQF